MDKVVIAHAGQGADWYFANAMVKNFPLPIFQCKCIECWLLRIGSWIIGSHGACIALGSTDLLVAVSSAKYIFSQHSWVNYTWKFIMVLLCRLWHWQANHQTFIGIWHRHWHVLINYINHKTQTAIQVTSDRAVCYWSDMFYFTVEIEDSHLTLFSDKVRLSRDGREDYLVCVQAPGEN